MVRDNNFVTGVRISVDVSSKRHVSDGSEEASDAIYNFLFDVINNSFVYACLECYNSPEALDWLRVYSFAHDAYVALTRSVYDYATVKGVGGTNQYQPDKIYISFLDAPSHLYKRVCLSVGPSVRPSVSCYFRRVLGASCAVYPALFQSFLKQT